MTSWSLEATIDPEDVESEDSGTHLVAYSLSDEICPLYVHLLSEDIEGPGAHAELRGLIGHRVRITIEDLGEEPRHDVAPVAGETDEGPDGQSVYRDPERSS